jgi:hypothetical protein
MAERADWALAYQDRIASVFAPTGDEIELSGDASIPEDGDGLCFPAP